MGYDKDDAASDLQVATTAVYEMMLYLQMAISDDGIAALALAIDEQQIEGGMFANDELNTVLFARALAMRHFEKSSTVFSDALLRLANASTRVAAVMDGDISKLTADAAGMTLEFEERLGGLA